MNKPTRQVFASQNLHALLKALFAMYAADLRHRYKGHTIRNAAVFDSAIRECSRLGYIELVNARKDVADVPDLIARRLKRVKHFPIWIMGPNFPDDPINLLDQLRPSMKGDEVVWAHHPSQTKPTWRNGGVTGEKNLRQITSHAGQLGAIRELLHLCLERRGQN